MTATIAPEDRPLVDPLHFTVTDVTETNELEIQEIDGHRLAGEVATSLAQELDLPTSSPWALRDDGSARMLLDDMPLGNQIDRDARLVVIPKSHLG